MTVTEIMANAIDDYIGDIGSSEGIAEAVGAALTEAGFAIVPLEATEQMIANGLFEAECCTDDWTASAACLPGHVWKAMVHAA